jgi:hypothetical protein
VKDPCEAVEAARRAAAGEAGGAEPWTLEDPAWTLEDPAWTLEDPALSTTRLMEWAILAPEEAKVYSTRRYGRPVTLVKRGLVRLLRQYLNEVNAQQSRFNALVAAHVMRLEERVEELERRTVGHETPPR